MAPRAGQTLVDILSGGPLLVHVGDAAVATAIAIDLGHLENWLNDIPLAPTRTSHFARLAFAEYAFANGIHKLR